MIVNFNGNKPAQNYYRLGVRNNNLTDQLVFRFDILQDSVDLSGFKGFVKVINNDKTYADIIPLETIINQKIGKIEGKVDLTAYATDAKSIDIQLEFQNVDVQETEDIKVWQSTIFNISFAESLDIETIIKKKSLPSYKTMREE